jgi:gamma-glutamylcyclotransferase (GGCT)/AIG2-like uncharacterized protein YtfP
MGERSNPRLLFVYGTLRRDSPNSRHGMLEGIARFVGHARMRGRLYELGGYPGVVPAPDTDAWVRGEVYELVEPQELLARLDEYEECGPRDPEPHEYRRVRAEVWMATGAREEAWVYRYLGSVAGKREIESGDYCDGNERDDRRVKVSAPREKR